MERKETNQMLKPAKFGAILLVAAVIVGVLVMVFSSPQKDRVEPQRNRHRIPFPYKPPLNPHLLQRLRSQPSDCMLMDDSWMLTESHYMLGTSRLRSTLISNPKV